jgi:hypothetical protein
LAFDEGKGEAKGAKRAKRAKKLFLFFLPSLPLLLPPSQPDLESSICARKRQTSRLFV